MSVCCEGRLPATSHGLQVELYCLCSSRMPVSDTHFFCISSLQGGRSCGEFQRDAAQPKERSGSIAPTLEAVGEDISTGDLPSKAEFEATTHRTDVGGCVYMDTHKLCVYIYIHIK